MTVSACSIGGEYICKLEKKKEEEKTENKTGFGKDHERMWISMLLTEVGLYPDIIVFVQNGNPQNPYCQGVQGVLEAYHKTLYSVQLYGPTNFAPCINHVARWVITRCNGKAKEAQLMEVERFRVLLICQSTSILNKQTKKLQSVQTGFFLNPFTER